jgi:aspartate dehydrogenase
MRVAVIGFGAIGRTLVDALRAHRDIEIVGVLERPAAADGAAASAPEGVTVSTDLDKLLGLRPAVVVECAGHRALREHGAAVLRGNVHLLVASIGALADAELESSLRAAASGGGKLLIPSGALAGLDALGAAKYAGLDSVEYLGRKAPTAWRGTRAETLIDLDKVAEPQVFFEGSARSAALQFPQNANVVAGVALAGLGFDETRVRLMVDPEATGNQHSVTAKGPFGEISTRVRAFTLPQNPKTSMLAPYSLVRTIRTLVDPLVV